MPPLAIIHGHLAPFLVVRRCGLCCWPNKRIWKTATVAVTSCSLLAPIRGRVQATRPHQGAATPAFISHLLSPNTSIKRDLTKWRIVVFVLLDGFFVVCSDGSVLHHVSCNMEHFKSHVRGATNLNGGMGKGKRGRGRYTT